MTDKNKKQKLLNILSLIGLIFMIFLGFNYIKEYQGRGTLIQQQVDVPHEFARQFSRVIKKNRSETVPSTPFLNPDNQPIDWGDLQGEYMLVNFWATWCAPCVVELPSLDKLQKNYEGKGLNVIAVSLDTMRDHDFIKKFLDNRNIGTFAAHFDYAQNIQRNIKMRGIPTTYLFDPEGRLTHIFEGDAKWDSYSAQTFFNRLLGNG